MNDDDQVTLDRSTAEVTGVTRAPDTTTIQLDQLGPTRPGQTFIERSKAPERLEFETTHYPVAEMEHRRDVERTKLLHQNELELERAKHNNSMELQNARYARCLSFGVVILAMLFAVVVTMTGTATPALGASGVINTALGAALAYLLSGKKS